MNAWFLAAAAMAAVYAVGEGLGVPLVAGLAKPWPVLLLAIGVWRGGERPGARWLAAALAVDSAADAVIEVEFLGGLAVFLVGHLLKIVAFTIDERSVRLVRGVPFFALAVGVGAVVVPIAGALGPAITVYAAVIAAMAWRAAARVDGSARSKAGAIGAVLFLVSDSLIAADRFVSPLPLATLLIMATYWGAQALIAASAKR